MNHLVYVCPPRCTAQPRDMRDKQRSTVFPGRHAIMSPAYMPDSLADMCAGLRELSLIVYKPAFHLMQWFRPTSTTLDTIETQGWAMCLAAASGGLHVLTDWQTEEGASGSSTPQDRATCLRILIDHMLPVLRSVSHPYDSSVIANNGSAVPADAALLMLMASARILHTCVALAASGQCAESILPQGVQPASSRTTESICSEGAAAAAGQPQGGDELLVILDSVLSMAYDLISGGPWWEQARAKHQLLLLHTLYNTSVVRELAWCWVLCWGVGSFLMCEGPSSQRNIHL
jgi:hypothetical protein